uniref:ribose-5-phosphate isomerase n=1 Tax=Hucho hucho TaxID=62062 RepID=A0A4W5L1Z2_9TELE
MVREATKILTYPSLYLTPNPHHTSNHQVVGVGSGSTIVYAVDRLGELVDEPFQILFSHYDLDRHPELDVAIDGVDEVDAALTLIKGGRSLSYSPGHSQVVGWPVTIHAVGLPDCSQGPVVTDNSNFILDWKFEHVQNWKEVNTAIKMNTRYTTGLFVGMAERVYFGMEDGSVRVRDPPVN